MYINTTKLPYYFYDINAMLPNGRRRWFDEFADSAPSIVQIKDLDSAYALSKANRNIAYSRWQAAFFIKTPTGQCIPMFQPKQLKWQVIQILSFKHSESSNKDWWEPYQDALFRVFVNPETVYDEKTGEHKQWYLLSPEDGYLVNRYEIEQKSPSLPPRDFDGQEKYLSADPRLRCARFVPVECCRHWRHETTGGQLPEGL